MLSGTANNPIYPRAHQSDSKDSEQAGSERNGRAVIVGHNH
jgi:hypothetical protein